MKRHIFNTFILGFAIASCTDPFMGQTATDHVAPGPIKNAKVINLEGSALITYDLPEDEDLLYIKATYQRNKDVIAQNKASVYTDTLTIVGLGDTLARDVEVVAVDRSGNMSEAVQVTIHPKTPPIKTVFKSLSVEPALSGIQLNWENEHNLNLAISVIRWDKKEYVPVETIYSSQTAGNYGVRKQKAKETKFGIFMRDQWMNYTDTSFVTVTPFYENKLPISPCIRCKETENRNGRITASVRNISSMPHGMTEVSIQQTVVVNYLIKLLLNVVKPINYGDLRFSKDPKTIILITRQTRRNTNYGVQTKPRIPTAVMMAGPVWELSNRLNPPAFLLASSLQKTVKEQS